jgi:hypothetical protein
LLAYAGVCWRTLTYADSVFAVDSMGEDGCVASSRRCYVVLLRDECCKGSKCISSLVENLEVFTEACLKVCLKVRKLVCVGLCVYKLVCIHARKSWFLLCYLETWCQGCEVFASLTSVCESSAASKACQQLVTHVSS